MLILFLHILFVIIGFGAVIVIDTFGLLWILKKVTLEQVIKTANVTQKLIWVGWLGLVATGIVMVINAGFGISNLVIFKSGFVLLLGVNGIYLHYIKQAFESYFQENIQKLDKFRIGLASIISQVSWWAAIIIGFAMSHANVKWSWPASSFKIVLLVYLVFLLIGLTGEILFKKKIQ